MTSNSGWFCNCNTTIAVHHELRELLICDFLATEREKDRFRLNCRSDLPNSMIQEQSVEKILDFLEGNGQFSEGNYEFIKTKVCDVHVAITQLIEQAESRILEIRENALMVSTYVIEVDPVVLDKVTREKVDAILLAVSEFIICRSFERYTNVSGLWERFRDLQTISNDFLRIWHGHFCKCRKYFGQKMILQFIASGAIHLSRGQNDYDYFKNEIFPNLEITLKESANDFYHVFKDCGALPVSVIQSSVLSYWKFDSVSNLDQFWGKYKKGDFHAVLQECFNSKEALNLLNAHKVSLKLSILESDYLAYRSKLVMKAPVTMMKERLFEISHHLSRTRSVLLYLLQSLDIPLMESLYASVSLKEYDRRTYFYPTLKPRYRREIRDRPYEIFCTSDEYPWKKYSRELYHFMMHEETYTNSTCVYMLGEAGCGKTTYCLRLLREWCQGEPRLQKFDYVFYMDLSVLESRDESLLDLICSGVLGNEKRYRQDVYSALMERKCLVFIDEGNHKYDLPFEIEKLIKKCQNCVFVFPMRPLHVNYFRFRDMYKLRRKVRFIQLLGLNSYGIRSLCSRMFVKRFQTRRESDPKQEIKKTEHKMKESIPESKGRTIGPDPEDKAMIDQQLKGLYLHYKTGKTIPHQRIKEAVPKYEIDASDSYSITWQLEQHLQEDYDSIMQIPMLSAVCVGLLIEGKKVPRNRTSLYLCLIDQLINKYKLSSSYEHVSEQGEESKDVYDIFRPYENIHHHLHLLLKLGKVAFDDLLSPESKLLYESNTLEGRIGENGMEFSITTGLLVHLDSTIDVGHGKSRFRFLHRVIQESLAAMHIVTKKEEIFETFCMSLTSVNVITDLSDIIMMVCSLSPYLGTIISRRIKTVIDQDTDISIHRKVLNDDFFIREFYKQQLSWYIEYKNAMTMIGGDNTEVFHVSDIFIDNETDKQTLHRTITLLSDQNVSVMSLYMEDVPTESGLSDKVLNDFLENNKSLVLLCIKGRGSRYIDSIAIPNLEYIKLSNVQVQDTSKGDKAALPLLSNLPKLQKVDLDRVQLNDRSLGLTSVGVKMPLLRELRISSLDMGRQIIELTSDMVDIESIDFYHVMMLSKGWKAFVESLIGIQHSFNVKLFSTDIDSESKEMIRSNKHFEVEKDKANLLYFKRV